MDRTSPPIRQRVHSAAGSSQSPQRDKTAFSSCQSETTESLTLNQSSEPSILTRQPASQQRHKSIPDYRQLDEAQLPRPVIHPLDRLLVIPRLRPKYVRHEGLRIPVVEGKPTRLYLHHNSMPWQKYVVGVRQGEPVQQGYPRFNCLRGLETLAIASTEDVCRNHELIPAHTRLTSDFVGVNIDDL